MKNGKDANDILAMPYHFVLQMFAEKAEPEVAKSFFDLL